MFEQTLPYYFFILITLFLYSRTGQTSEGNNNKVSVFLTFLCMTLFAGLRNISVGTDTGSYVRSFQSISQHQLANSWDEILQDEVGYYLLQRVASCISTDYWSLLCLVAGLCYAFVLRTINNHSENKVLSLFVYITLGYYTFCFNAARQAIALSIYLLAIPCIINRRFVRYCVVVLIAALFHKTVIIALPLYFLFTMKYSWKSITLVIVSGITLALMLPNLLLIASQNEDRYLLYSTGKATGGYLLTAFYVLLAVFFIIIRSKVSQKQKTEYDIFLQMLICGSVVYLIVSLTGSYVELTRFAAYFQIASIFLFAKIYNGGHKLIPQTLFYCICVGCMIFFYIFITTMAALTPYSFNPLI